MSRTILLAVTKLDGLGYIADHPELAGSLIVTPRTLNACRGFTTDQIHTTASAAAHPMYDNMLALTAPCTMANQATH